MTTNFIEQSPELFTFPESANRAQRILKYLGNVIVNGILITYMTMFNAIGPMTSMGTKDEPPRVNLDLFVPKLKSKNTPEIAGLRKVLVEQGPAAFATAVRRHKGLLLTDTTMRDAHQSLLATRMRTIDMKRIAPFTAETFANAYR